MKKLVVAVVVLVVLLTVAPWGVGKVAEKRLDRGLEQLIEVAPYLTVVERKYTPGWFTSEQVVTFEAFGSWMNAFSPKALEDAMAGQNAEAEPVESTADAEVAADAAESPDEAPVPEDAAEVPEPPSEIQKAMRFTVRNEVLHGPVLGLSGFGIARVNSHLVLDEKIRKELEEVFGTKSPVEVTTRVGFLGGGTTTFKSEGRTIKPDAMKEVTWDTFRLSVGYSRKLDRYDIDGKWPKLEIKNRIDKSHFVMTGLSMDGEGERVRGDLYDGDFRFGVEKVSFLAASQEKVEINEMLYLVNGETKGEFTGMGVKLGVGEVKSKELSVMGIEIKEAHYDLSVRRLHAETLEKVLAEIKAIYAKPLTSSLEATEVMFAPIKERGMELLKYDPEFVIDRIGFATAEGDGYITGVVKLKGATAEDFGAGSMGLIGKIHADITIDVSEKMVQKFPNGSTSAGAAVDSGYVKREGDRLICKIVYAGGELTVNGKPQAIPGLGGTPPAEDPAADTEAAPQPE
ncbi:MAG TPA: YdgA family protein [Steroidobacteraceae bacterium]|nr:YdgA family protein [Steroidobacteraceae bacterium]